MKDNDLFEMYSVEENDKRLDPLPVNTQQKLVESKADTDKGLYARLELRITELEKRLHLNEARIRMLQASNSQKDSQLRTMKQELANKVGYD